MTARWRVETPRLATGAIAVVSIESDDLASALGGLGLPPVAVGGRRVADLFGVDRGVIARPGASRVLLLPHAGRAVVDAIAGHLRAALGPETAHEPGSIEERLTDTLARAPSPLAIDLLLEQPRRWRASDLDPERTDPNDPRLADASILRRLVEPPVVAAVGAPNIGKSTLLNALAGRDAAIVRDEPGTTRDHLGVALVLDGLAVRWLDTPGLLDDPGELDRRAIDLALDPARRATLVLLCADAGHRPPSREALGISSAVLRVGLRADLGAPASPTDASVSVPPDTEPHGLGALACLVRRVLMPDAALADTRPWAFWA